MSDALKQCEYNWEQLGCDDPLWAVLTEADKSGGRWCVDAFLKTGASEVQQILEHVRAADIVLRYDSAMDFGCGVGRLTHALAKHFDSAVGVDIADSMVEAARKLHAGSENCNFFVNKEPHLRQFPDAAFDFILSIITLQHVPPDAAYAYMAEFTRLLRPGGTAVFQVPTGYDVPLVGPLLRHVPSRFFHYYRKLKYANKAVMDMHVADEKRIQSIMSEGACDIRRTLPSESAGAPFADKLFIVHKKG